ncbi:MAG: class I SAM-dependent methyltransferase [Burkholderiales bacterium]
MTNQKEHGDTHRLDVPSAWVTRWAAFVPAGCTVLDVACGSGRHARYFAGRGHAVEAVDRDAAALGGLSGVSNVTMRCADLESAAWPYAGKTFGAIVVTNYLYRPLFSQLLAALTPGGVLIYETFALGNERFGRPANPDFLLKPGELLDAVRDTCRVIAYEDVYVEQPRAAVVQRICAVRES